MTSIGNATRTALATAAAARKNPQPSVPAPVSVRLFSALTLSAALSRELDRTLAGPVRLPGAGEGDADMVLHPVLDWQPGAAEAAEHLRAGMAQPASPEVIQEWLAALAVMVANAPADQAAIEMQCAAIWRLCSGLPAVVWSEASIDAYCDAHIYWPAPARLRQFLQGRRELLERQIAGFEKIAEAPRNRPVAARASTEPYDPGPAPSERSPHPSMPKSDATDAELAEAKLRPLAQAPARTIEQMIAELGGLGTEDLLAKRRRAFEPQPQEPKP